MWLMIYWIHISVVSNLSLKDVLDGQLYFKHVFILDDCIRMNGYQYRCAASMLTNVIRSQYVSYGASGSLSIEPNVAETTSNGK